MTYAEMVRRQMEVSRQLAEGAPLCATAEGGSEAERYIQEARQAGQSGAARGREVPLPLTLQERLAMLGIPSPEEYLATFPQRPSAMIEYRGADVQFITFDEASEFHFEDAAAYGVPAATAAPSDEPPLTFERLREIMLSIPHGPPPHPWVHINDSVNASLRRISQDIARQAEQSVPALWAQEPYRIPRLSPEEIHRWLYGEWNAEPDMPFLNNDARRINGALAQQKARQDAAEFDAYMRRPTLLHTQHNPEHDAYSAISRHVVSFYGHPDRPFWACFCECGKVHKLPVGLPDCRCSCGRTTNFFEIEWEIIREEQAVFSESP